MIAVGKRDDVYVGYVVVSNELATWLRKHGGVRIILRHGDSLQCLADAEDLARVVEVADVTGVGPAFDATMALRKAAAKS